MKARMNMSGGSIRAEKIAYGRILFQSEFQNDPSYNENFVVWQHGVSADEWIEQPIKLYNRKYSSASGNTTQFETFWDKVIPVGTVLYDTESKIYYLCIESFDEDRILNKGKIVRCNGFLKWQDDEGYVYEYPVFDINSTQYNSGVESEKVMTLGSTQHMLSITADEHTIALEHDKRFFLDRNTVNPTVFKLTQNDTTAMNYDKGILKITLTEDQFNADTDSIDEWLCDYKTPPDPVPTPSEIEINYTGQAEVRVGGSAKSFTADTLDIVTWNIVAIPTIQGKLTITLVSGENKCKIKCERDDSLIGSSFKLQCTDTAGNIGELLVDIVGGV